MGSKSSASGHPESTTDSPTWGVPLFPPGLKCDQKVRKPRLLVSVATSTEVEPALAGGADIIDVKNPAKGALGRVSPQTLAEVVRCVAGLAPVTAAWGELAELAPLDAAELDSLHGVSLVKLGTAGLQHNGNWRSRFESFRDSLPRGMSIAIVHYADWHHSDGLDFEQTLRLAVDFEATALVIDTHGKQGGSLLAFYPPPQLGVAIEQIQSLRLRPVLAGSLRVGHLESLWECGAPIVAVRGAACQGGHRQGPICRAQVANLKQAIHHLASRIGSPSGHGPPLSG